MVICDIDKMCEIKLIMEKIQQQISKTIIERFISLLYQKS